AEELLDHGAVGGSVPVPDHRDLADPGDPRVRLHPDAAEATLLGHSERALKGRATTHEHGRGADPGDPKWSRLTHCSVVRAARPYHAAAAGVNPRGGVAGPAPSARSA